MIKILHIMPDLAFGGVEKVVLNYYQFINREKYHFDYVSHGEYRTYHKNIQEAGSRIYYLETIGKIGIKDYIKQINKSINLDNYDLIHVHTGDITGLYAYAYRRAGAKKIICHSHTAHPVTPKRKLVNPILRLISLRESDYRIACGKMAGDYCFGNGNYYFLPNAIDISSFQNISQDKIDCLRNQFGITDNDSIVGHIGTFLPVKNHQFLLEVLIGLLEKRDNVKLVLVGLNTDSDELKQIITNNKLTDYVIQCGTRTDINVIFKLFDVFLLPSLFEGMPMVGVEAQAAGVDSIFSNTIDKAIDLSLGLVTFLPIDQGPVEWVNKIIDLLDNKSRLKEEEVQETFENSNYSIRKSVAELEHIYSSLLK